MSSSERYEYLDYLDSLSPQELLVIERESPDDVDLLVLIGKHYLKLRQLDECHEYYSRALAIDPEDGWSHLFMGNLGFVLSCHDEAIAHFKIAIQLLPDVPCPHWALADVYAAQGYLSRAETHYRRAVEIDPDDQQASQKLSDWLANNDTDQWRT